MDAEKLYSVAEATKKLKYKSQTSIEKLIGKGLLRKFRFPQSRKIYVLKSEVSELTKAIEVV
jgi:hypothetical protein